MILLWQKSQTQIKTALWALSTIIFLIVVAAEIVINVSASKKSREEQQN